jgi:hypothetical protein
MRNTDKKRTPNLLNIAFLLGVISAKWISNHRRKRIRVHLPLSKKQIADALRKEFGGTVHVSKLRAGVTWQATSDESLLRLKEAARRSRSALPPESYQQIVDFVSTFC